MNCCKSNDISGELRSAASSATAAFIAARDKLGLKGRIGASLDDEEEEEEEDGGEFSLDDDDDDDD